MVPDSSGYETHPDHPWVGLAVAGAAVIVVGLLFFMQTGPRVPAYEWRSGGGPPPPVNLDSFTEIPDGVAVLSGVTGDGVTLWWSRDGSSWNYQQLEGSPSQLATAGDRLLAYRTRSGQTLELNGEEWNRGEDVSFPEEVRTRQASGRPSVTGSRSWLLEMSLFGNLWWGDADAGFQLAISNPNWGPGVEQPFTSECAPPTRSSPDVPPVVISDAGVLALVSSNPDEPFGVWPVCEPVVWVSPDGREWTSTSAPVGTEGTYVYDLVVYDGTFVAVGGQGIGEPIVWSSDDGVTWRPIDFDFGPVDVFTVDGGGAGWAILGRDTETSAPVGWTSVDGRCWEPMPTVAGGTDVVVTDEYVIVVDRSNFPIMWRGEPTGSDGVCR